MAILRPFRAVGPSAEAASRVASPPYDVLTRAEAHALAADRPESFLRVTRAEIDLPADMDPHADAVYARARDNFARLLERGTLVRDAEPALYAYRLRRGTHAQLGVFGTFAVSELRSGVIKPHERTRRDKEDDRTRHIETLGAQTGPVFLAYRATAAVDAVLAAATAAAPPLYDFAAEDGVTHTLWRLDPDASATLVRAFEHAVPRLYIADGHHRAAAATRVAAERRGAGGDRDFFLAAAFPHDQLQILPYHRVVRDLGRHSPHEFPGVVAGSAGVHVLDGDPAAFHAPGSVAMYVGGRWYAVHMQTSHTDDPVRGLDTQMLQDQILQPVLRIVDPRTDPRIDFVGGIHGTEVLQRRVDSGEAAVAFAMQPLSFDALVRVADAGEFLPPKSTWFEPKLRDGLLVHAFAD